MMIARRLPVLFASLFIIFSHAARSESGPSVWWDKCKTGQSDCEYSMFKDITRLYRPSHEEGQYADYIRDTFNKAKPEIWKNNPGATFEKDSTGNILIRVPAT